MQHATTTNTSNTTISDCPPPTLLTMTMSSGSISPLHSFFASLPAMQDSFKRSRTEISSSNPVAELPVLLVHDNARGLAKTSSASEKRRLREASIRQRLQHECSCYKPAHSKKSSEESNKLISRWQSETLCPPPSVCGFKTSPPAPRTAKHVDVVQQLQLPMNDDSDSSTILAPKIPTRRSSMDMNERHFDRQESSEDDDDDCYCEETGQEETTAHSRSTCSTCSSSSSTSSRSKDHPLAAPRRQVSFDHRPDMDGNVIEANVTNSTFDVEEQRIRLNKLNNLRLTSTLIPNTSSTSTSMEPLKRFRKEQQEKIKSAAPRKPRRMSSFEFESKTEPVELSPQASPRSFHDSIDGMDLDFLLKVRRQTRKKKKDDHQKKKLPVCSSGSSESSMHSMIQQIQDSHKKIQKKKQQPLQKEVTDSVNQTKSPSNPCEHRLVASTA